MKWQKAHNLVGDIYINTLGRLINYERLAYFLSKFHDVISNCDCFVDLACGPGRLLKELERSLNDTPLFGIDIDERQVNYASKTTNSAIFLREDIFNLENVLELQIYKSCFVHLGFSFMNTLEHEARIELIKSIYDCEPIKWFGFEIQNQYHIDTTFLSGKWYDTQINRQTLLKSMSQTWHDNTEYRKLTMRFIVDNVEHNCESMMYSWSLDTCLNEIMSSGWNIQSLSKASYREMNARIPTHWFILCGKHDSVQ